MKGQFMGPGIHPCCLKPKAKVLFSDAIALLPKVIGPVGWTKPLSTAVNHLVPKTLTLDSTFNLGGGVEGWRTISWLKKGEALQYQSRLGELLFFLKGTVVILSPRDRTVRACQPFWVWGKCAGMGSRSPPGPKCPLPGKFACSSYHFHT